jgi:hypothetical protein
MRNSPFLALQIYSAKLGISVACRSLMGRTIQSRTESLLDANYIPALIAYEYRGYIISAWARPEFANGATSVGIVYKRSKLGSIIQVKRIEGELFESKEQAEQHGVELCKEWIDKLS